MVYTFLNLFGMQELAATIRLYKTSQVSEQKVDEPGVCRRTFRHFTKKKVHWKVSGSC